MQKRDLYYERIPTKLLRDDVRYLGNILGNEGINIASFNLGRTAPLKDAMALIGIDSPVNEKVISEVKKLDSVVNVKSLNFNIM